MSQLTCAASFIELKSQYGFHETVIRLIKAIEGVGMTLFASIDHAAAASKVGLSMPPTTVLIYGNPRVGTLFMLMKPSLALDLPLRVLVREEGSSTYVAFHPASSLIHATGLNEEQAAVLSKAESLIETTISNKGA